MTEEELQQTVQDLAQLLQWTDAGQGKTPEALMMAFSLARRTDALIQEIRQLQDRVEELESDLWRAERPYNSPDHACYVCGPHKGHP
jgi:predicted  nucleic acid-binding Zn-ribbon protein